MQMNLLRKGSLLEFRAASSSDAVKPTPSVRIGFGRAGAAAREGLRGYVRMRLRHARGDAPVASRNVLERCEGVQ